MDKLELTFKVEKDTKNTRRYQEEATDGPPIIGTLYIQQWALRKLTVRKTGFTEGGENELPEVTTAHH
ncbi:MAG: hypothetical protein ISS50_02210 [Anaerolineae bacterium]|nr:hypothetical protein [Anaerolineae bacterium]